MIKHLTSTQGLHLNLLIVHTTPNCFHYSMVCLGVLALKQSLCSLKRCLNKSTERFMALTHQSVYNYRTRPSFGFKKLLAFFHAVDSMFGPLGYCLPHSPVVNQNCNKSKDFYLRTTYVKSTTLKRVSLKGSWLFPQSGTSQVWAALLTRHLCCLPKLPGDVGQRCGDGTCDVTLGTLAGRYQRLLTSEFLKN